MPPGTPDTLRPMKHVQRGFGRMPAPLLLAQRLYGENTFATAIDFNEVNDLLEDAGSDLRACSIHNTKTSAYEKGRAPKPTPPNR